MPIPSSTTSFSNIQNEFGGTNPISLSEYYNVSGKYGLGITGIPVSGQLSINNFRGKSKPANVSISISGTNNTFNTATDNANYRYALFTNNGTFSINGNMLCDILIVGGGGGGGAGGGGAGGFVYRTNQILNSGTYNIIVGDGGIGGTNGSRGNDGNDSYIQFNSVDFLRAYKGGGGGTNQQLATAPNGYYGSTGGNGHDSGQTQNTFPAGTLIGGNIGGVSSASPSGLTSGYQSSGGGGGAGGAGQVGVAGNVNNGNYGALGGGGGIGIQNSITGIDTYYAGGGGGGTNINSTTNSQTIRPQGGLGGGGNGNLINNQVGTNGIANTGGGGGGSDWEFSSTSGTGGSGVIIIRYAISNVFTTITGNNNTINTPNDNANYRYAFFANSGIFSINKNLICDILIVGGGGGGGGYYVGGGGGGWGPGYDGGSGSGATGNGQPYNGGIATRGLSSSGINSSITYYGNNGGYGNHSSVGGGGGGANEAGNTNGNGGNGKQLSITGTSIYYGGGGGGGMSINGGAYGIGGLGGGGNGGTRGNPTSGAVNTGGGGGGSSGSDGGIGGSGVLIIRYSII